MSSYKPTVTVALLIVVLAGCGTTTKQPAGSRSANGQLAHGHGVVDDPRTKHLKCMQQHHLPVVDVGQTGIQVGSPPAGPRIQFTPTPGAAQQLQISGQVEGAEVIGSALLYPEQASDAELKTIEDCLAQGVQG